MAQTTETSLPPLGKDGDLPAGIYRSTLRDTLLRFNKGSRQRFAARQRLERIYGIAVGTGQLARFVVFGSFVTAKREPADVNVFLLMQDTFDMGRLTGEARVLFDHAAAQAHFGASVFWPRRPAALGGEEQAIAEWQIGPAGASLKSRRSRHDRKRYGTQRDSGAHCSVSGIGCASTARGDKP